MRGGATSHAFDLAQEAIRQTKNSAGGLWATSFFAIPAAFDKQIRSTELMCFHVIKPADIYRD